MAPASGHLHDGAVEAGVTFRVPDRGPQRERRRQPLNSRIQFRTGPTRRSRPGSSPSQALCATAPGMPTTCPSASTRRPTRTTCTPRSSGSSRIWNALDIDALTKPAPRCPLLAPKVTSKPCRPYSHFLHAAPSSRVDNARLELAQTRSSAHHSFSCLVIGTYRLTQLAVPINLIWVGPAASS